MTLWFDVYWSMRSPYCYLALDRLLGIEAAYEASVRLRPVYPIAVRDPGFFKRAPAHYRPYHTLDSHREAEFHGIPFRRPNPDPIVMDMRTNAIAPEQPFVRRITRLCMAAAEQGRGMAFLDTVMRLLWDGSTDHWDKGSHLHDAIARAGLDAKALLKTADDEPERMDRLIAANEEAQKSAGHMGVPLCVFDDEPFFGQDRLDRLVWRMKQRGLRPRAR